MNINKYQCVCVFARWNFICFILFPYEKISIDSPTIIIIDQNNYKSTKTWRKKSPKNLINYLDECNRVLWNAECVGVYMHYIYSCWNVGIILNKHTMYCTHRIGKWEIEYINDKKKRKKNPFKHKNALYVL